MRRIQFLGAVSIFAVCSAGFSSAEAQTLVSFDFENSSVGQVVGDASFVASGLTASFDMANNGVEGGNGYARSYTRFVGSVNYPRLNFSTTVSLSLDRIDFDHQHNHNPGFPTHLDYGVDLQLDRGTGFVSIASFFADPAHPFAAESFAGPGLLSPGSYSLR